MIPKEELAAIKADLEGWAGVGPCQECGLDKHVLRLVAEVGRLLEIERQYSLVRCGLKKRGTEDRCPNPAEHNIVGHGPLQVCDKCFGASRDGKAEIWRESEIRKEPGE